MTSTSGEANELESARHEAFSDALLALGEHDETLQAYQERLERLEGSVDVRAEQRDQLRRRAARPPAVGPVLVAGHRRTRPRWWDLAGLDEADRARKENEIREWADWLRTTYWIRQLPSDWPDHAALRAELTALYAAWRAAYKDPGARQDMPTAWHDTLHRFIQRIPDYTERSAKPLHPTRPAEGERRNDNDLTS